MAGGGVRFGAGVLFAGMTGYTCLGSPGLIKAEPMGCVTFPAPAPVYKDARVGETALLIIPVFLKGRSCNGVAGVARDPPYMGRKLGIMGGAYVPLPIYILDERIGTVCVASLCVLPVCRSMTSGTDLIRHHATRLQDPVVVAAVT